MIYMYTCIHIYICICIRMHIFVYVSIHVSLHLDLYIYIHIYMCIHIRICVYICIFLSIYIYVHLSMHICVYMCIYIYTQLYAYTYIYMYITYILIPSRMARGLAQWLGGACCTCYMALYSRGCIKTVSHGNILFSPLRTVFPLIYCRAVWSAVGPVFHNTQTICMTWQCLAQDDNVWHKMTMLCTRRSSCVWLQISTAAIA